MTPLTSTPTPSAPPPSPSAPRKSPPPALPKPPEWAIERLIKFIGRAPAFLGKLLDRAAKVPVAGRIVRFFSSVWLGILFLVLIALYIAIGSGFPDLRAAFEMTDLQFFDWWPMRILLSLLAIVLITVTLRRIPFTLFKLGSWTVHIGILTLIGGCVWYFSHKQEGSVRIYLNKSVDYCYDVTERALYAFPMRADGTFDTEHPTITPLPNLPIYNEHLADDGNPVDITLPAGVLPNSADSIHITGYYPYAELHFADDVREARSDETGEGPAIAVAFTTDHDSMNAQWLIAGSPARRVIEGNLPFSVEYLDRPSPERVRDLQASFTGPIGMLVRIPKLNIERVYAAAPGTPIAVEGSNYTLTPGEIGEMPMASKGYEDATSTELTVNVSRKDGDKTFEYQRMCLSRYPERSPDFISENGKMARKQDGVDPDIQLVFLDAQKTEAWIVQYDAGGTGGGAGALSLIVRTPDGHSTTQPLADKPVALPVKEVPGLQVQVMDRKKNVVPLMLPAIIPPEERPRGQTVMEILQFSMIDLDVSSGAGAGGTQSHVYVPFSPYAEIGNPPVGEKPAVVETENGKVGLLLATMRRQLPSRLTLDDFKAVKYPGAVHRYEDYVSTISALDAGAGAAHPLVARLNNPAADHGLYYFQAAWDGDDNAPAEKRFSVIGVSNRPGITVMLVGAILIVAGIGFAFYIKPMLLKAKKDSLAAWSAARKV